MRSIRRLTVASILVLCASVLSPAQEGDFSLSQGRVGEPYQQNIQKVLAERYGVRLESGTQTPNFEWAQPENLPPGLTLSADGTITGVPRAHQEQPYRVKVRVADRSMREAEALEVSLSVQILPPRIRLVRNNGPRLVPINPEPGPPVAGVAEGNGDGNGALAAPARVAAPPQPTPAPAGADAGESDVMRADANIAPTPQGQNSNGPQQEVDVNEYLNIFEQTDGGNKFVLHEAQLRLSDVAQRLAGNALPDAARLQEIAKEQLKRLNFRLRADHESTIALYRANPTAGNRDTAVELRVSAQLLQDDGAVPVNVYGDPVTGGTTPNTATLSTGPLQAGLETEGSTATINLKKANARAGNTLVVVVDAYKANQPVGTRSFDIELTNYGWESGISPSMFLLNRQRVRNDDIQPVAPTTPGEAQLINTINPVNYSPFPGISYTFTYKGNERKKNDYMKTLQPGFGVNVTFMDFNDETVSVQQALQTLENRILREQSDVQLGIGAVVSFFGNKLQVTYGGNLSVDRKRAYFGIGVDFLKLLGLLQ